MKYDFSDILGERASLNFISLNSDCD